MSLDCSADAEAAGLFYSSSDEPGLARRRRGKGFVYLDACGRLVTDQATLERIRSLAVPPAWTSVWICPDAAGHLQAVGFDERGRKQYRYHPRFRATREAVKFDHLIEFAEALPALRRRIEADMGAPGLGRDKVVATVAHLLESTMIRVGNLAYAKENKSFGLTTLRSRHVDVDGERLRFHFKGKSGRIWRLGVRDRRVARIVRQCQDLPGQNLFQYHDEEGALQTVTSADVNAYLKTVSGADITAKDFRTWTGTVLAANALAQRLADGEAASAKALTKVLQGVSARLGNTVAVCRKGYVHPQVIEAYLTGVLKLRAERATGGLRREEAAVLAFLRRRAGGSFRALLAGGG